MNPIGRIASRDTFPAGACQRWPVDGNPVLNFLRHGMLGNPPRTWSQILTQDTLDLLL
jgi:hypothetical protein